MTIDEIIKHLKARHWGVLDWEREHGFHWEDMLVAEIERLRDKISELQYAAPVDKLSS